MQYICPLPVEMFKPDLVEDIDNRLRAECSRELKDFQFFGVLKRVNRFMMYFVSVGIFDGDYLHRSFRMWADEALVKMPTIQEMVQLGLRENQRFKMPSRWVSEATMHKMAAYDMIYFKDGLFWWNDFSIGVADLPDDLIFAGRTKYAGSDPVPFPD